MRCRNVVKMMSKPYSHFLVRDKSNGNLLTGWTASGVKMAGVAWRLLFGTGEPAEECERKIASMKEMRVRSTDVFRRGRPLCSSVEGLVMGLERREWLVQTLHSYNYINNKV